MNLWDTEIAALRKELKAKYEKKGQAVLDSTALTMEVLSTYLGQRDHFRIGSGNKEGGFSLVGHATEHLGDSDIDLVTLESQVGFSTGF
jgi:hypothetical protein